MHGNEFDFTNKPFNEEKICGNLYEFKDNVPHYFQYIYETDSKYLKEVNCINNEKISFLKPKNLDIGFFLILNPNFEITYISERHDNDYYIELTPDNEIVQRNDSFKNGYFLMKLGEKKFFLRQANIFYKPIIKNNKIKSKKQYIVGYTLANLNDNYLDNSIFVIDKSKIKEPLNNEIKNKDIFIIDKDRNSKKNKYQKNNIIILKKCKPSIIQYHYRNN